MKRFLLSALVLSALVLAMVVTRGVPPAESQEMPPALVVTEPVASMEFHEQLTLVGRVVLSQIAGQRVGKLDWSFIT